MTKPHEHRPRVAGKLPKHVPDKIKAALAVCQGIDDNAGTLPAGFPPLSAKLRADTEKLATLESQVKSGPHGTADLRDRAEGVVDKDVEQIEALAQQSCDADPAGAAAFVAKIGLHLYDTHVHGAQTWAAHEGGVSQSVHLTAPAEGGAYEFECSLDGGTTWSLRMVSDLAHATFTGLPVGTKAVFRHRITRHGVTGDWSAPIAFVVR